MALKYIGTDMDSLGAIPVATLSNGDTALAYYNLRGRTFTFDPTETAAEDLSATANPYYKRPDDNPYPAPGVWVEDIGTPEHFNGYQVATGAIRSLNLSATSGSVYQLDNAYFKMGGTNVTAQGAAAGIFLGLDVGAYKAYIGDGADQYFKFDGTNITWKAANSELNASGNLITTGGSIGGWTLGANSLTSGYIGLHSNGYAEGAEILLGHATAYASAKIGLKADGSGKLANGNISWTAAGLLTATLNNGGSITLDPGADMTITGDDSDPGLLIFSGSSYNIQFGVDGAGGNFAVIPTTDQTVTFNIGAGNLYNSFDKIQIISKTWSMIKADNASDGQAYVMAAAAEDVGLVTLAVLDSDGSSSIKFNANSGNPYFAPSSNNDIDFGRSSYAWKTGYFGTSIVLSNSVWIGLGSSAGRMVFTDTTVDYVMFSDCNVGIGAAPGDDTLRVNHSVSNDTGSDGINIDSDPTFTTSGTYYNHGLNVNVNQVGTSGQTNSGYLRGIHTTVFSGVGNLATLQGLGSAYGHYTGDTGTTTNAYGLRIVPYQMDGTVTNSYGIYISAPLTGGTVTNEWSMYIADNAQAWFAGNVSALSFTDRTPFYEGDALSEIKKIKGKKGKIDHSTLPSFARRTVKKRKYDDREGTEAEEVEGRDLGAMISLLTVGIQQITERLDQIEAYKNENHRQQ